MTAPVRSRMQPVGANRSATQRAAAAIMVAALVTRGSRWIGALGLSSLQHADLVVESALNHASVLGGIAASLDLLRLRADRATLPTRQPRVEVSST